jgi:hypothetical protein
LSTRCKGKTEAVKDNDVLKTDDDKESAAETPSISGKLGFSPLVLIVLFLNPHPFSFPFFFFSPQY